MEHLSSLTKHFSGRRVGVLWLVLVLLLALWSTLSGPGWNPTPTASHLAITQRDTQITTQIRRPNIGSFEVISEVVTLTLRDGAKIPATLRVPVLNETSTGRDDIEPVQERSGDALSALASSFSAAGHGLSGMVFLHGTGTDSYQHFSVEAPSITSTGIVTLVPQKRTANYSVTHRDYEALARDYEDALNYLVGLKGIDASSSGLYAVSEGCYIGPIVAAHSNYVSYVVLVSAPVIPIRQQGAIAADRYLRNLDVPEPLLRAIPRLLGLEFRGGDFNYADFNPAKYFKQIRVPVLMAYGTNDMSMPLIQGPEVVRDYLKDADNTALTVRYYGGTDHGLKIDGVIQLEAMRDVAQWVSDLPFSAHAQPSVAGATPHQPYWGSALYQPRLFAYGGFALASAVTLLVIIAATLVIGGILSLLAHLKKVHLSPALSAAIKASFSVLLAWILALAYIAAIAKLALSYEHNRLVVQGGYALVILVNLIACWRLAKAWISWYEGWKTRRANLPKEKKKSWRWWLTLLGHDDVFVLAALLAQLLSLMVMGYWGVFPALGS